MDSNSNATGAYSVSGVQYDEFRQKVTHLISNESVQTEDLVRQAERMISALEESEEYNIPLWLKSYEGKTLHMVLKAMLVCAPRYETPDGTDTSSLRYTAAAICACQPPQDPLEFRSPRCLSVMQKLATIWFTHVLSVCESIMF